MNQSLEQQLIIKDLFDDSKSELYLKDLIRNISNDIDTKVNVDLMIALAKHCMSLADACPVIPTMPTVDVCGTGGDKKNTLNVSTATAMLLARCKSINVLKHGNSAVSSKSGSADVLKALNFDIGPQMHQKNLSEQNICFLMAPFYHKILGRFAKIRAELASEGLKTVFNLLGPMINPCKIDYQLVGVFTKDISGYARVLVELFPERRFAVVRSNDGMDEISVLNDTFICEYNPLSSNIVRECSINSKTFDIPQDILSTLNQNDLIGKDPSYNALKIQNLLNGQDEGNLFKYTVLANTAFALYLCGIAQTPEHGFKIASTLL